MSVNLIDVIKTAINKTVNLSKNKVNKSAIDKLYTQYNLTTKVDLGSNYSSATTTATLIGNYLRIYVNATRSSATNDGNITNEQVCTLVIITDKILDIYNAAGISATIGDLANFYTTDCIKSGSIITIPVYISATAGAITEVNFYINLLVRLNPDAYL